MKPLLILTLVLGALTIPSGSVAHEVRPAYLQIREGPEHQVRVTWKQPVMGDMAVPLTPRLSSGWLDAAPTRREATNAFLLEEWTVSAPHAPLQGQTLTIMGLQRTITDVLVQIEQPGAGERTYILHPASPSITVPVGKASGAPILAYFSMGVTHIWTGFDHLLYLLGLILLIPRLRTLLKTITAFTVAHSITLAAAVLGLVKVSPPAVEATIALSIVFVAVELVQSRRGRPGLAHAFPWIVAFGFGLLHGLGFASALREIGLPRHDLPQALLLFNLGIEVGQIAFAALVIGLLAMLSRATRLADAFLRTAPYAIGAMGAFWVIQRVGVILTR